jgi:hypothetical protein
MAHRGGRWRGARERHSAASRSVAAFVEAGILAPSEDGAALGFSAVGSAARRAAGASPTVGATSVAKTAAGSAASTQTTARSAVRRASRAARGERAAARSSVASRRPGGVTPARRD